VFWYRISFLNFNHLEFGSIALYGALNVMSLSNAPFISADNAYNEQWSGDETRSVFEPATMKATMKVT